MKSTFAAFVVFMFTISGFAQSQVVDLTGGSDIRIYPGEGMTVRCLKDSSTDLEKPACLLKSSQGLNGLFDVYIGTDVVQKQIKPMKAAIDIIKELTAAGLCR